MPEISKDTQALLLNEQLRDLQAQRAKTRPALYLLLAIVFGLLFFVLQGALVFLCILLAVASLLAMFTAISKGVSLDARIHDVKNELDKILK